MMRSKKERKYKMGLAAVILYGVFATLLLINPAQINKTKSQQTK